MHKEVKPVINLKKREIKLQCFISKVYISLRKRNEKKLNLMVISVLFLKR